MNTVDVFRHKDNCWIVVIDGLANLFSNQDEAFDYAEESGVIPDESDAALIAMVTNNHTRAHFGVIGGTFLLSDNASYNLKASP